VGEGVWGAEPQGVAVLSLRLRRGSRAPAASPASWLAAPAAEAVGEGVRGAEPQAVGCCSQGLDALCRDCRCPRSELQLEWGAGSSGSCR